MVSEYIQYSADLEPPVDEEEEKVNELIQIINRTQDINFSLHRHYFRGTHVKVQGIVKGTLTILPDLPEELAQGLAAPENAKSPHPVAVRYANEPSFLLDDRGPGPRGCSMKVFNVEGQFMDHLGSETKTQDLTFNNAPNLELRDVSTTVEIFRLREKYFREPDKIPDAVKKERKDADVQLAPFQLPNRHFLGYNMYSQSAYKWGNYVAKYGLFPTGELQQQLENKQISEDSGPEQHSIWLREWFGEHDATYDLRVQLLQDKSEQSVEDTSVTWDEEKFPFRTVGRVVLPKGQDPMDGDRRAFWDDGMKLNVWYGLEAHRPLGSVNRLRKRLYQASVAKRAYGNSKTVKVISDIDEIP